MRWRGTVVLTLVLLVAAALAYRDVRSDNPDATWNSLLSEAVPTAASADIERLLDFAREDVTALRIERDALRFQTRRAADGWSNVRSARRVDDYLASLQQLAVVRRLDGDPTPDSLGQYGLAPPRAVIALTLATGAPIRLLLGDPTPAGTGTYCRRGAAGPVIVTGALARWDLDHAIRALLPTPTDA